LKNAVIFIIVIFSFNISYTQEKQLPAEFVYGNNELDSFIIDNFVRPLDCIKSDIAFDIWLQFTVDSLSQISFVRIMDIQTTHDNWSDSFKENINKNLKPILKEEAIRVIKETAGFWIPRELDGKPTWEIIDYKMEIRVPEFYSAAEMGYGYNSMLSYKPVPDTPADNPIKYYNLGVKKMEQKKQYIAIKYFKKSIELGNKTKDVYYNLGVAEYLYGLIEDACKSWSKAVELGDEDAKGLLEKNCK